MKIKAFFQHRFNGGHLFCRFRALGFSKKRAITLAAASGIIINWILY